MKMTQAEAVEIKPIALRWIQSHAILRRLFLDSMRIAISLFPVEVRSDGVVSPLIGRFGGPWRDVP